MGEAFFWDWRGLEPVMLKGFWRRDELVYAISQKNGLWPIVSNDLYLIVNWEPMDPRESDCLIKTKQRELLRKGLHSLWFLPSALNVKVKKFNQARVNGGSNYDSLKVAKCLVIQFVTRMNGSTRFLLSLFTI